MRAQRVDAFRVCSRAHPLEQPKAAGNICTEELVLLCEELGIATGVDLDQLIEVGRLAEDIVGHQLPGELIHAGSLDAFRRERLQ